MKELWTARVHLLTPPAQFGNTKAFTNVVTWADGPKDFTATISTIFARRSWSILTVQQCKRVAECAAVPQELSEQIEEALMQPGSCIFGTLHYYPSKPA